MFFDNIRFQMAALFFLLIMVITYIRMDKLPLLSTKHFDKMFFLGVLNIIMDFVTVYTVSNIDTVPEGLNRLAHQLFVLSINALMTSFYFYVRKLCVKQRRDSVPLTILQLLPFVVSSVVVAFGSISYYNDGKTAYSYGMIPSTIFFCITIYMLMALIVTRRHKNEISKEKRTYIYCAMLIWIIAAAVQFFNKSLLVSGLAIVLMIFFLFLSFQNPKELIDADTGAFNKTAYGMMLDEYIASGRTFYELNIVIKDMTVLYNLLGRDNGNKLIKDITESLKKGLNTRLFSIQNNTLTALVYNGEEIEKKTEFARDFFKNKYSVNNVLVDIKVGIYVLECPKFAKNADEIFKITRHITRYGNSESADAEIIFVNEEMVERQRRNEKIRALLAKAIENDGFEVFYQPIYDVKNERFASAEALVRIRDTEDVGFVSPEEFIPIAEKSGMIMEIGAAVFRSVCRFAREQRLSDFGIRYIEVNLSGVQAVDVNISAQLKEIMTEFSTPPRFINLEITETAAVDYKNILKKNMQLLRKMGCSFSMDDFGTGYSNLSQMAEIQYDLIKLDKSLIWACFDEKKSTRRSRIVLENIVSLIRQMSIRIVAEGVETAEQVEYLRQIGIDYMQGYYFSKPLSEKDYLHFINAEQGKTETAN